MRVLKSFYFTELISSTRINFHSIPLHFCLYVCVNLEYILFIANRKFIDQRNRKILFKPGFKLHIVEWWMVRHLGESEIKNSHSTNQRRAMEKRHSTQNEFDNLFLSQANNDIFYAYLFINRTNPSHITLWSNLVNDFAKKHTYWLCP